jgi:hypothetical protein
LEEILGIQIEQTTLKKITEEEALNARAQPSFAALQAVNNFRTPSMKIIHLLRESISLTVQEGVQKANIIQSTKIMAEWESLMRQNRQAIVLKRNVNKKIYSWEEIQMIKGPRNIQS